MKFLEDGDFINFEDDEVGVNVLKCFECEAEFEIEAGTEPTHCPMCNVDFI